MRITASHIVDWANTHAKKAQTELPRLIRRLCFDISSTHQLAFPSGDSTYMPGWDGVLSSERNTTWIPLGVSYWEFGCHKNIEKKVNGDYQKRVEQTSTEQRSEATFIFITPRRWQKKNEWIENQKQKNEWADVRAYDADDLEQWLEQTPVVALQFAEELGLSGDGIESLARYWQIWAHQCNPIITPEAFFKDRENIRNLLLEKCQRQTETNIVVSADSTEEAVAFTVATLMTNSLLENQALVITKSEGWRFIQKNPSIKIAITAQTEVASTPVLRDGLITVIPYATGDLTNNKVNQLRLERPNIYEFEKALITIGMENSDARRYALSTGRSWTVLRRQRSPNPAIQNPAWLKLSQTSSLVVVCLLGTWNADRVADHEIVERLANKSYDEIERDLNYLAQLDDAPVLQIGRVWKAKSPLELLNLFGSQITQNQLDRFFVIAKEILTASDPQLELPEEQRYAAQIYGKVHPYSELLVESICDSLIKLAVRGYEQNNLRNLRITNRVDKLIHDLFDGVDDIRWLSLASYLPSLAEAAPDAFLLSIEKSLNLPNAPVTRLITESSNTSGITGRCWHAGLLWALETLAWTPKRLAKVALILARLSKIPMQGNWGNKPSASLFGLFRSWLPQTAANLQERIQVLDLLITKEPDIAFTIVKKLTNIGYQTASPAAHPKWREDDAGVPQQVPNQEILETVSLAKEKLIQLSKNNVYRLADCILHLSLSDSLASNILQETLLLIKLNLNNKEREVLRAALRNKIHKQLNLRDTKDNVDNLLNEYQAIYHQLEPDDLLSRYSWLFDIHVELPISYIDKDYQYKQDKLKETRMSALAHIYSTLGICGIENLVISCGNPWAIGFTLSCIELDDNQLINWIVKNPNNLHSNSKIANCLSGFLHTTPEPVNIITKLIDHGKTRGWAETEIVALLTLAKPNEETLLLAVACGKETEIAYWNKITPNEFYCAETYSLSLISEKLLEVCRPRTALKLCTYEFKTIYPTLLYKVIHQSLLQEEAGVDFIDSWYLEEMLEYLENSNEINRHELIQLEFGLFPLLAYEQEFRASFLYEGIMSEPQLFTELICILYKPEHEEREEPINDGLRAAADRAWRILHHCTRLPGTQADGSIDHNAFTHFINSTRELCKQADRLTMCDQTLGNILAHSPEDKDGTWPFAPARDILEYTEMKQMRRGFSVGVWNKRGMTTRSPWDGGNQERILAAHYRTKAAAAQCTHPNVALMLEAIAKDYEYDGKCEDIEAQLRKENC